MPKKLKGNSELNEIDEVDLQKVNHSGEFDIERLHPHRKITINIPAPIVQW